MPRSTAALAGPSAARIPMSAHAVCDGVLIGILAADGPASRSEEHTSELQSHHDLVCRLLLEKKNKAGKGLLEGTLQAGTSAVSDKLLDLVGLGGKSAADKGKDTRDYLAAAFPELNAWERAGADASSAGMVDAGFDFF